jgi:cytochrome c5
MNRGFGLPLRMGLAVALALVVALMAPLAKPAGAQGGAARPEIDRPDGPVWNVIRKNCISCHGIDDYAFFAQDRAAWDALINTKHTGASAVSLEDNERTLLLDYLVKTFGPDATPFPRGYIPPEIDRFFTAPEANRLMNDRCTACHDLKQIEDGRHDESSWRVILVRMRERGATLTDEELETLTEWLGRVKGVNQQQ